jgi:hypothetical protein
VTFRPLYAVAALFIFLVEVGIALFVRDDFVRPYAGDVLAVMLVCTALRAITPLRLGSALAVTLAIALVIELAQAANLLGALGLADNALARTVLGGSFDWFDLLAYGAGAVVIVVVERMIGGKRA